MQSDTGLRAAFLPFIVSAAWVTAAVLAVWCGSARAEEPKEMPIGIIEHLGEYVPMDATFFDEKGREVTLKQLVGDKPFLLSLVYYRCPGLCNQLLNGLAEALDRGDFQTGVDFKVISISFDARETPELALNKKNNYVTTLARPIPDNGWRFLTGTAENIARVTEAVGFRYVQAEDGNFIHSAAIMAIAPDGKIARYLMGASFLPFDIKLAMLEASEGRVGPTISKVLMYCFSYEPESRRYTFNILRVMGLLTTFTAAAFLVFLIVYTKKKTKTRTRGEEHVQ